MTHPLYKLYENIHELLENPSADGLTHLTKEKYDYYHYCCDGFQDTGFGCGYRTVQSICSMLKRKLSSDIDVPSIHHIQKTLVKIGDKDQQFFKSRGWIGTVEGSYIFDELFNVASYIIHIPHESKLSSKKSEIIKYFREQGGLIFMGGDTDAASKMITGVHVTKDDKLFLQVVDPHFSKIPKNPHEIIQQGYVKWYSESDFLNDSFYNLCMCKLN